MKLFRTMLFCAILVALLCSSAIASGPSMEKATVYAMHKVPCDSSQPYMQMPTQMPGMYLPQMIPMAPMGDGRDCMEYELRTAKVSYIIRPRRDILLLLGGDVYIRFANSELLLRADDTVKDIRCAVLSMTLRSESERHEHERARAEQHPPQPACYNESGLRIRCPEAAKASGSPDYTRAAE